MRRLLISAAIPALAAGVFALPAATASAAPMPAHGPSGVALVNAPMPHGPLIRPDGRADLNPQPLPPGVKSQLANAADLNPPPGRRVPSPGPHRVHPTTAHADLA